MRKKPLLLIALACGVTCVAGFTACGHKHTFSDEWSHDAENHWHQATCEHTEEKSELAQHIDSDKDEKCDICMEDMHVHKFDDSWTKDEINHWHAASCGHEDIKGSVENHVDKNNDGECDVCEYQPMNVTVGGTYYSYENGEIDSELYIVLNSGKWTDDEGMTGDYSVSGKTITLFITLENEKTEFASGIVNGDDISLDMFVSEAVYRKGADLDTNKPKEKSLSYALSDDRSYYIVKGIGSLSGEIEVPDEWKKKPVKEIAGNAFANSKDLTGIVIGDNVEKIGEKAFYNCASLTSATLGAKVGAIELNTFEKCAKLSQITFSSSVKSIAEDSFKGCTALTDIYFQGTASDWVMIDFYCMFGSYSSKISNPLYSSNGNRKLYIENEILTNADLSNATQISAAAFYGYKQLKSVKIGSSVGEIGEYAFANCGELETLEINSGLNKVGNFAFNACRKLTSAVIPDSVTLSARGRSTSAKI